MVTVALLFAGCGGPGFKYNGLYWQVGPDRDMTWSQAKEWVDGLDGDWRMPSIDELEGLWDAGIDSNNWGPFENSGYCVWSGDTKDSGSAWGFAFNWGGREDWFTDVRVPYQRAFAVRSQ